ncbi:Tat pathway signal protein [Haladaptatus sp. W1]|uniref:DUF7405 family protein n=1 Tax=Haladaptatus sp. W1 TaxID=1897478 RepID=UPI000849DF34|nr:Dyp-type peroxidase domain-containing protein [Haladaptatus sp. W1]ODR79316.1 Tat pathway signal protein [Haladaptatus sp. W1]
MSESTRGIPRREFMKAAVAIGGSAALSACLDRGGMPDVSKGPSDLSTLPERQHAWNRFLATDDHGNNVAARHKILLFLNYRGDGTPTDAERETVERSLRSLERAYKRGHDGLLFSIGYSPSYFERFGATDVLPKPKALASFEDPKLDEQDAVVQLESDHPQLVLAAEEALLGNRDELNGVDVSGVTDVFEKADRRTGFVGDGLPANHQDVNGIPDSNPVPEDAPLYMGFKSGFKKNQASEDRITIRDGPFAGGTTQHISNIELHLDQWYEQDSRDQRVGKMFCPVHAEKGKVEGVGNNLGDSSEMTDECIDHVEDHARERGMVGHSQKAAGARKDDSPVILRRDFDSTDGGKAGLHFVAFQRTIEDFESTRTAMNGDDLAGNSSVGQRLNNGILQYMTVTRRGNFLVPPRSLRSLPTPNPK